MYVQNCMVPAVFIHVHIIHELGCFGNVEYCGSEPEQAMQSSIILLAIYNYPPLPPSQL